ESDAVRRLGALGVRVAEDGERLAQRLRLSNADAERLTGLEAWRRVSPELGGMSARALLYRLGPGHFAGQGLVAWSRSAAGVAGGACEDWRRPGSVRYLPLRAAFFGARVFAAGRGWGAVRRAAKQGWLAVVFPADPAVIQAIADRAAQEGRKTG